MYDRRKASKRCGYAHGAQRAPSFLQPRRNHDQLTDSDWTRHLHVERALQRVPNVLGHEGHGHFFAIPPSTVTSMQTSAGASLPLNTSVPRSSFLWWSAGGAGVCVWDSAVQEWSQGGEDCVRGSQLGLGTTCPAGAGLFLSRERHFRADCLASVRIPIFANPAFSANERMREVTKNGEKYFQASLGNSLAALSLLKSSGL